VEKLEEGKTRNTQHRFLTVSEYELGGGGKKFIGIPYCTVGEGEERGVEEYFSNYNKGCSQSEQRLPGKAERGRVWGVHCKKSKTGSEL